MGINKDGGLEFSHEEVQIWLLNADVVSGHSRYLCGKGEGRYQEVREQIQLELSSVWKVSSQDATREDD